MNRHAKFLNNAMCCWLRSPPPPQYTDLIISQYFLKFSLDILYLTSFAFTDKDPILHPIPPFLNSEMSMDLCFLVIN